MTFFVAAAAIFWMLASETAHDSEQAAAVVAGSS